MKMQKFVLQKIKEPKQCETTFANPVAMELYSEYIEMELYSEYIEMELYSEYIKTFTIQ